MFALGGLIVEVFGHERRADAFLGKSEHVEGAGEGLGASDDDVADADLGGWLSDGPIDADGGASAGIGGVGACLVDADGPKPFIQANGVHVEGGC